MSDLNGDAIPDLVVTAYDPAVNKVCVRLGTGGGAFGARTDYATNSNPFSVAIGNLNAGGVPDLVVANWNGANISVYLGSGGGAFSPKSDYSTVLGSRPIGAQLVDINSDGKLDVITADWANNSVKVLLGNGLGALGASTAYNANNRPYQLALGDLNGDGRLDVVAANRNTTTLTILLGQAGGTFGSASTVTVGSDPSSLALADLNGDAKLDVVCSNFGSGTISRLLGTGTGTFNSRIDTAVGAGPQTVAISDLDLDSKPDLVVAYNTLSYISVLSGNGTGGFLPSVDFTVPTGSNRAFIADLDVDGKKDLVVASYQSAVACVFMNTTSNAPVPSAANSTVPTLVSAGPDGTCCFDVIVRDLASNPIAGSVVTVAFSSCPVTFCPSQPAGITVNGPAQTASAVTNATGIAHMCVCLQSQISACNVAISADGVTLGTNLVARACPTDTTCAPGTWHTMPTAGGMAARYSADMASNYDNETILLFGGENSNNYLGDTWRYDGFSWSPLAPATSPTPRSGHTMVYDRIRKRIVLFGGFSLSGALGDTWEFDGTNWQQVATSGPDPRYAHTMAWDEYRGRTVLFGGTNGVLFNDTWEWDGTTWTAISTTGAPPARRDAAMAFDLATGLTTIFGGAGSGGGALGDMWMYDGQRWSQYTPQGFAPAARSHAKMIFSPEGNSLVLYGGSPLTDGRVWRFIGGEWYPGPNDIGPRIDFAFAYDHFNDHSLTFGGRTTTSPAGGLSETRRYCGPCPKVAALLDTLGNLIPPTNATATVWPDEAPQTTSATATGAAIGSDDWPNSNPCDMSFGDDAEPEVLEDPWEEEADSLGLTMTTEAEFEAWLGASEEQLNQDDILNRVMFPDAAAAVPPYTPAPLPRRCLDPNFKYAFGGRDIIFVHGLRTKPLKEKTRGENTKWNVGWVEPNGQPGWLNNPEFYNDDGYWKVGANKYWELHIQRYLKNAGYSNRYLVIAWPSTQHLEYGMSAFLTQVSDAMNTGKGVVDLSGEEDTRHFGDPSFVVISHSTGGPLVSAALAQADIKDALNAHYIADHAKAHVAIQGAFGGSGLATLACTVSLGAPVPNEKDCTLFQIPSMGQPPPCVQMHEVPNAYKQGVTWDLMPKVMQRRWGPWFGLNPARTVTVTGGHPTYQWALKHRILTGVDDGVLNTNSVSANPNSRADWPSGYLRPGRWIVGARGIRDHGINDPPRKRRSRGYYRDQAMYPGDKVIAWSNLFDFYTKIACGVTDTYSPTGMVQPKHTVFKDSYLDPNRRYGNHYSFIESSADHFGMTPNISDGEHFWGDNEYRRTFGLWGDEINREENRVTVGNGLTESYSTYHDSAPLLDNSNPSVTSGIATESIIDDRCAKRYKNGTCKRYKWHRSYVRLKGWETKMAPDYVYSYLLTKKTDDSCWTTTDVADGGYTFFARNRQNPFGRDLTIEFQLPTRAQVDIDVYDVAGRRVRSFERRAYDPGPNHVVWDGRADDGSVLRPGLYVWRMRLDGQRVAAEKAMMLN